MNPQNKHQIFKEWLDSATIEELEKEIFELDETNFSVTTQIEQHDFKAKTQPPTQESEDWRLRADHLQRWTYYQKKAIERRIVSINIKNEAESKAENARLSIEVARLKSERAANHYNNVRLKHERATSRDKAWIATAKMVLDEPTFKHITNLANELMSADDRQQEEK